jgi:hypothetical protein
VVHSGGSATQQQYGTLSLFGLSFVMLYLQANGLLWSAYGVAVPDAFIYGPNMVSMPDRPTHCTVSTLHCAPCIFRNGL